MESPITNQTGFSHDDPGAAGNIERLVVALPGPANRRRLDPPPEP